MNVRIYLALQEIADGRVQFRRWSPDIPYLPNGDGQNARQTIDAHLWIQRMVYKCAKEGITPPVKWVDGRPTITDDFLQKIRPFEVVEMPDTEETDLLTGLRDAGIEHSRFVGA